MSGLRVKPMFAWFDFWIGAFYDQPRRRLYLFPLPMFGVRVDRPARRSSGGNR